MSYERIFQIRYLYAVHVYVERDPPSRHKSTPAVGNCLWLISTKRDRLSNHTFDNYVFENQVKKVIIFCQFKKKIFFMPTYKDDFTEFYLNLRSAIGSDITSNE